MSGAHIMFQAHVEYNSPPVIIKPVIIIIREKVNKIHPILLLGIYLIEERRA
jgi:hypothetical protein